MKGAVAYENFCIVGNGGIPRNALGRKNINRQLHGRVGIDEVATLNILNGHLGNTKTLR